MPLVQERVVNLGGSPVALGLPVPHWPLIHQYYHVENQSFNWTSDRPASLGVTHCCMGCLAWPGLASASPFPSSRSCCCPPASSYCQSLEFSSWSSGLKGAVTQQGRHLAGFNSQPETFQALSFAGAAKHPAHFMPVKDTMPKRASHFLYSVLFLLYDP